MIFDPSSWQPFHLVALALAAFAGWAVGFTAARRSVRAARLRELEQELEDARRELANYREQVAGHFTETSKHLRDLALQYRTVYEHLADGARTLCPEAAVPIEAGLPGALLAETSAPDSSDPEPPAPAAESTVLAEAEPAPAADEETALAEESGEAHAGAPAPDRESDLPSEETRDRTP